MSANTSLAPKALLDLIAFAGPAGLTPDALERQFPESSRSTINRRLAALVTEGAIKPVGSGRAVRYQVASPFTIAAIEQYLALDPQARPLVSFDQTLLQPTPGIDPDKAVRLQGLNGLAGPLDKKFLSNFLIDFSWGSSVLEGGTYSDLDTQALLLYGERNPDKPMEDALLILNHKSAIEHLWEHRDLTVANICAMQSMLTDQHGIAEVMDSDHFLPVEQRGIAREYADVNLQRSAYLPPFRPGTGYIEKALNEIVDIAKTLHPVESAFYLMTRIPYLQPFANGNKRTARLAANLPLLSNGLLPISFVDFNRAKYIQGMAAFYELGSPQIMEGVFVNGYVRSIFRGSQLPASIRVTGFDIDAGVSKLASYVQTGTFPKDAFATAFVGSPKRG
ncbi:MAG: Fic family protein [Burkholderiaceae bacterium]|nr:Fic family protein [Burkholderiaceae bacterium]